MKEWLQSKEHKTAPKLRITFVRHSSKGSDGNLTPEGVTKAEEYGIALLPDSQHVKIYTSDIQRSIDTGNKIFSRLDTSFKPRVRVILSEFPYTDEKIKESGLSGGKWLLLEEGNEFLPSTKFMAGKIAFFAFSIHELSKRMNNRTEILAISHVPPMMCFLGHIMAAQDQKEFIDEDVRSKLMSKFENKFLNPLEGFTICFGKDENNLEYCKVDFCGESATIPLSLLRDWANTSK